MSPIYDYKCIPCGHVDAEMLTIGAAEKHITKHCGKCEKETKHLKIFSSSPGISRVTGCGGSPSR